MLPIYSFTNILIYGKSHAEGDDANKHSYWQINQTY